MSVKLDANDLAFEESVLGGLMMDNSAINRVDFLKPEMFTGTRQEIMAAILEAEAAGKPYDALSLSEFYSDLEGLGKIQMKTSSSANIRHYANRVLEQYTRRRVVQEASELIDSANTLSVRELVDLAQTRMLLLTEENDREACDMKTLLKKSLDALEERFQRGGEITGQPTGFTELDKRLCGLQPSDLVIIAGRPSMGKTTFAMNIAENILQQEDGRVLVFSMEMPKVQLSDRLICQMSNVPFDHYRSGSLTEDEWPHVSSAVSKLQDQDLLVDDSPALTVMQIRSRARRYHRKKKLSAIVIDYVQLMSSVGSENRRLGIEEITRGLKALAKELNIPVIALSQLSRDCEKRPNKRPIMSDLRESGSIEQDADVVMFVYRDELYNEDSPDKGTAEIITAKQRNGATGTDRLTFLGRFCRFEDFAVRDRWAEPELVAR